MLIENHATEKASVVQTIASQKEGIEALAAAIKHHEALANHTSSKKKLLLSKTMQLIVAKKMQQLNYTEIEEALSEAMQTSSFNIFEFAKKFF